MKQTRVWIAGLALGACATLAASNVATLQAAPAKKPAPKKAPAKKAPAKKPAAKPSNANMMPLKFELPPVAYMGTPKNLPPGLVVEKLTGKARPAIMVPKGTVLLSQGKEVTSSDTAPVIGDLSLITDGDKKAQDGSFVELGPYKQWVQIDLGRQASIAAIVLWHSHMEASVYNDVVVQVSDDKDFVEGVKTIYNNDRKNTIGLGRGTDPQYFETAEGRLINAKGVKGRYVRTYSNGSTSGDENRYTEISVYGK
jgi:hypothetical protein